MGKKAYEVVESPELSSSWDPRFVIVDVDTGEILDDAQGYGYKSRQKAHAAYGYKNRDKSKDRLKKKKKQVVIDWCKQHKKFIAVLEKEQFIIAKGAAGPDDVFDAALVKEMFKNAGYTDLPFTIPEFLKYW